jgi:hypothetical protein
VALAALLPTGEIAPVTHWIEDCVGPRTGLHDVGRIKYCLYRDTNSDPSAVQPLASCYTDCAVPFPDAEISQHKTDALTDSCFAVRVWDKLIIRLPQKCLSPGVVNHWFKWSCFHTVTRLFSSCPRHVADIRGKETCNFLKMWHSVQIL